MQHAEYGAAAARRQAQSNNDSVEPSIGGSAACIVARIVDGDTFVCRGGSRIRLLLVDTDESGQSVYADSAAMLLRQLMPEGSPVRLEFDVQLTDRYRRLLAYVFADSVFVNRELARRGIAHVMVYPTNVRELDAIRAAADSARDEKLGIWAGSAFQCASTDYRARRCREGAPEPPMSVTYNAPACGGVDASLFRPCLPRPLDGARPATLHTVESRGACFCSASCLSHKTRRPLTEIQRIRHQAGKGCIDIQVVPMKSVAAG
jgi:micrococcal nuclease